MRTIKKNTKFKFDELYMCCTVQGRGSEGFASDDTNVVIQDEDKLIDVRNYDNRGNETVCRIFTLPQILSTRENEKSSLNR